SGTLFRDRSLSPELYFEADHFKSQNSISRRTTLRVWNSFRGGLYDILKIQTFHFEDWTLFEDLVTIFEDYFEDSDEVRTPFKDPGRQNTVHLSKVCGWIPRKNFEGLGLPGTLQNFEGALRSSFYYFFEIS
ncbi:hypothetical protein RclHR1_08630001, partial [Rhizophagus clarus]